MSGDTGKRLSPAQWIEIRQKYLEGEKVTDLSKQYGVARQTIHTRVTREQWKQPLELKQEAIIEVQEELKKDFKTLAAEEIIRDKRVYAQAREVCVILFEEIKQGRLPGQRLQQFKAALECFKMCSEGMRSTLGIDGANSPFPNIAEGHIEVEQIIAGFLNPAPPVRMLEGESDEAATIIQAEVSR